MPAPIPCQAIISGLSSDAGRNRLSHGAGPSRTPGLLWQDFNDVIFAAEAVGAPEIVARVVVPFSIHPKAVLIAAGENHHGLSPYSFFVFAHGMGIGIPLVEVSHQNYLLRCRHLQHKFNPPAFDRIFLRGTCHVRTSSVAPTHARKIVKNEKEQLVI
jgi:hypothetical protein